MMAVNVLAVLDDLIADMGDAPGTTGHQVAQARAAVAELVGAADEASVALGKSMQHTQELCSHMRLCAALANVSGGAA